ncbi:MAG: TRAP transporter large permease [Candidimonas sp.]|jgi:C4-dicarboxylate transporter DctM subunit
MDLFTTLGVFVGTLTVLLLLGTWMPAALGMSGITLLLVNGDARMLESIGSVFWNQGSSFVLLAIPLFIFMGEIVLASGVSSRFYRSITPWARFLPGQLYNSNIIASALFSSVCGSSVATAAAVGTVAIPELRKAGYADRLTFGTLAVGGTLGILIPPSSAMIIYGSMVNENIAKLFIAGILPGLVIVGLCIAYIIIITSFNRRMAPADTRFPTLGELARSVPGALPLVFLMLAVIGSLYTGFVTPTEAAAVGVLGALAVAGVFRSLNWSMLKNALEATVASTCMLMFIILSAQIIAFAFARLGVTRELTDFIVHQSVSPWTMLLIVVVLYLVLGCFLDAISMMVMTLPLIYPVMMELGFDSVWLGVVLVLLMEIGLITPPVGLNLFVLQRVGGKPLREVALGSLPFVGVLLLGVLLLAIWPEIALWLPNKL